MNKDKRETEYPVELESQFIMRLPDEPAKALRDLIKSGENFRNRLTINLENDMRNGEIRFDHWLLHAKIVDLPTIIESLKTIDRKSVYKTANICQLMLCKDEIDCSTEEEMPNKKKKDPLKVDKKFLWPHGITPPTKNIRKRRFRKTLRKKCAEAPEIEKEVKRLLRADNEAISVTWEVIKDENENTKNDSPLPDKPKSKKNNHKIGFDLGNNSKVEDIFGGAVSDSDGDDENIDIEDGRLSVGDGHFSDSNSIQDSDFKGKQIITQFKSEMFTSHDMVGHNSTFNVKKKNNSLGSMSNAFRESYQHDYNENTPENVKLQQLNTELEELKLRKHRTQLEISGLQNMSLKQRFQDILQTLNNEIRYKEVEIKKMSK